MIRDLQAPVQEGKVPTLKRALTTLAALCLLLGASLLAYQSAQISPIVDPREARHLYLAALLAESGLAATLAVVQAGDLPTLGAPLLLWAVGTDPGALSPWAFRGIAFAAFLALALAVYRMGIAFTGRRAPALLAAAAVAVMPSVVLAQRGTLSDMVGGALLAFMLAALVRAGALWHDPLGNCRESEHWYEWNRRRLQRQMRIGPVSLSTVLLWLSFGLSMWFTGGLAVLILVFFGIGLLVLDWLIAGGLRATYDEAEPGASGPGLVLALASLLLGCTPLIAAAVFSDGVGGLAIIGFLFGPTVPEEANGWIVLLLLGAQILVFLPVILQLAGFRLPGLIGGGPRGGIIVADRHEVSTVLILAMVAAGLLVLTPSPVVWLVAALPAAVAVLFSANYEFELAARCRATNSMAIASPPGNAGFATIALLVIVAMAGVYALATILGPDRFSTRLGDLALTSLVFAALAGLAIGFVSKLAMPTHLLVLGGGLTALLSLGAVWTIVTVRDLASAQVPGARAALILRPFEACPGLAVSADPEATALMPGLAFHAGLALGRTPVPGAPVVRFFAGRAPDDMTWLASFSAMDVDGAPQPIAAYTNVDLARNGGC